MRHSNNETALYPGNAIWSGELDKCKERGEEVLEFIELDGLSKEFQKEVQSRSSANACKFDRSYCD